jgi:hypothetical protein
MGAHDFSDRAFGKTAQDAFRAAYDAAVWEYGHDGYNGTISTVASFREFVRPKSLTDEEFEHLVWQLEWNPDGLKELMAMPVRRKFANEWDRQRYLDDRALVNKLKKLTPADLDTVRRAAGSIQKWECCVCYKADPKVEKSYRERLNLKGKRGSVYNFFGLASC